MITVKIKKQIKDAKENKIYSAGDKVTFKNDRFKEIQTKLGDNLDKYFEIIETTKDANTTTKSKRK